MPFPSVTFPAQMTQPAGSKGASTIIPVRGLAEKGILRDPSPYQLDPNAWSLGSNVRIHANKVQRAPIFRSVYAPLPAEPVFVVGYEPSTGYDLVFVVGIDGSVNMYQSLALTSVTPTTGYTTGSLGANPQAFTATFLGDVLYINQPTQAPIYYGPQSSAFATLPNMETTWTCRSLRAFYDYLIAFNVTKPATYVDPYTGNTMVGGQFPNMVKWSDLTLDGQVPDAWDPDNPNISAGENPLASLSTPIVDGVVMRQMMVIYSEISVWGMVLSGDNNIFAFQELFSDGGLIAPNCAVEVAGVHYCFGPNHIYMHDGVTKQSIVDKRNRETIFRYLNTSKSEVCFAAYLPQYDSVIFGFNSGDPNAFFPTPTSAATGCDRCNVGAVYDLKGDTWSFIDLPNVSAFTLANLDTVLDYNTPATTYGPGATVSYANIGGSYYDQENSYAKAAVACAGSVTGWVNNNYLLAYDFMNLGSLSFPYQADCNAPAFIERTGLDLDTLGSDLTTAKKIRRIYPLVYSYDPTIPVQVLWGGSMYPSAPPTYLPAVTFNPTTQYKVDGLVTGRYLAIRFTVSSACDFEIAGFDLDVTNNGRR
jgi:hypothetical protein